MAGKAKIAMVAPSRSSAKLAEAIFKENKKEVMIYQGTLADVSSLAPRLLAAGAEVVMSRGATALEFGEYLPVATIPMSQFDLLAAFRRARDLSERPGDIGYVGHERTRWEIVDFGYIESLLGVNIRPMWFRDPRDIARCVAELREMGVRYVVGGASVTRAAAALGLKGVFVECGRESILEGLARAEEIVRYTLRYKSVTQRLHTVIGSVSSGVLGIDEKGVVTIMNRVAEDLLEVRSPSVVGKDISAVCGEHPEISAIYGSGSTARGEILKVRDVDLVVTRVPIIVDGQRSGMVITFDKVSSIQRLEQRIRWKMSDRGLVARYRLEDIACASEAMRRVVKEAEIIARSDLNVLIQGETGTGKEMLAQGIHNASGRRDQPFVAINCAALPEPLLESELFGYEEGAFTGARRGGKPGLFELAHGGTIFLDEIGEMPPSLQARLLRVVENKVVMRLGGTGYIPVDTRVICATNRDLRRRVESGEFRNDLYYRLNVLSIRVPPLRERPEDVRLLLGVFLERQEKALGIPIPRDILEYAGELSCHSWPGNVRQLENAVAKYCALAKEIGGRQAAAEVLADLGANCDPSAGRLAVQEDGNVLPAEEAERVAIRVASLRDMMGEIVRDMVAKGTMTKRDVAKKLGISRSTLYKYLSR